MLRASRSALALGLAACLLTACGDSGTDSAAAADAEGSAACPNGRVRFGVEPYEAPAKLTPAYQALTKALEKGLGCPVELIIVQDYSAEVLAMKNGQLELGEFGPLGFVFASLKANAEPVASFADANAKLSSYRAGIWVPKASPITDLGGLKGKTLALSSIGSTSGDALPRYALRKQGITQSQLKLQYAGGHPQALLALTKGKVAAAEINTQQLASATAAGQFDEAQYRRIWESEDIPNDPITVWGGLDKAFRDKVRQVLVDLAPSDVAAVGKYLDVDPAGPLVAVDKSTYQPLFDLAEALKLTEKDV